MSLSSSTCFLEDKSFQICSSLVPSPTQLSVACSTWGEPGNEASSIVLLFSTLVEHEEVHSKHFIDLHKWTRQAVADTSCSLILTYVELSYERLTLCSKRVDVKSVLHRIVKIFLL